jgi:hypothetical protein
MIKLTELLSLPLGLSQWAMEKIHHFEKRAG